MRAHTASSEMEAMAVQAMLKAEGVDSAIQSRQIPMYDGIAQVFNPAWGYVIVREGDLARAEGLVRQFLESPPVFEDDEEAPGAPVGGGE